MFTICHIEGGNTYNVFPDEVKMQGTIRSYDNATRDRMKQRITEICEGVAKAHECEAELDLFDQYPAIINHPQETDHVIRLAKHWFGEDHFSTDDLPLSASEDFSYFLQKKPGCFFALGTMKEGK